MLLHAFILSKRNDLSIDFLPKYRNFWFYSMFKTRLRLFKIYKLHIWVFGRITAYTKPFQEFYNSALMFCTDTRINYLHILSQDSKAIFKILKK